MSKLYETPLNKIRLNSNGLPVAFRWRERWYIVKSCVVKTLLGQGIPRLRNKYDYLPRYRCETEQGMICNLVKDGKV